MSFEMHKFHKLVLYYFYKWENFFYYFELEREFTFRHHTESDRLDRRSMRVCGMDVIVSGVLELGLLQSQRGDSFLVGH